MQAQQIFQQAQQLHQQKQLPEAEKLYRQVVQVAPHFAEAKHLLGLVCSQQGRHEEGTKWVIQAIQKQMGHPPYYNNLGLIYARMKDWKKACEAYQATTRLAPKFAEAWFNLANANKAQEKIESAISCYEKTIKFAPRHGRAMYNLGNTLLEIGKPKSARKWFENAITVNPNYAEAHNNLGSALDAWKEHDLAFKHYEKAVELKPNFRDAIKNFGNANLQQGNYQQARILMTDFMKTKADTSWNELILSALSPVIFENKEAIAIFQNNLTQKLKEYLPQKLNINLVNLQEQMLEPTSNMPYQGQDVKTIKALYGQLFDAHLPEIQRNSIQNRSKPRIGFVVTNGHEGVFLKCMGGILNQLDTNRFEIFVVCSLPNGKEILSPEITNPSVQYLGIPRAVDKALAVVAQANFDVLHYWEVGTDYMNYFLPFFRLAPVQCTTWGWPVTSGIPQMDYFISAEGLETPASDDHYTEKLIRFKKLPTYYYRPPVPTTLKDIETFGLPSNIPVYLCAQNLRKVHPDFDQLVKAILEKDEKGIVVFINDSYQNVTKLLQERLKKTCGQNASRIHFLERMPAEKYLNLIAIIDVILDTLYYTGGANTAFDAFAAGTPYVTLPQSFHRSRFGAAAYRQIGVESLIAKSEADYVEKAIQVANDKTFRKNISEQITANAYKVFEDSEAVRELEDFFLKITQ